MADKIMELVDEIIISDLKAAKNLDVGSPDKGAVISDINVMLTWKLEVEKERLHKEEVEVKKAEVEVKQKENELKKKIFEADVKDKASQIDVKMAEIEVKKSEVDVKQSENELKKQTLEADKLDKAAQIEVKKAEVEVKRQALEADTLDKEAQIDLRKSELKLKEKSIEAEILDQKVTAALKKEELETKAKENSLRQEEIKTEKRKGVFSFTSDMLRTGLEFGGTVLSIAGTLAVARWAMQSEEVGTYISKILWDLRKGFHV